MNINKGVNKMIISLIKKEKWSEMIKEFSKKYGSVKKLERMYKKTDNNLFS
jgi:hypothetical protein